jgi:DNA primase
MDRTIKASTCSFKCNRKFIGLLQVVCLLFVLCRGWSCQSRRGVTRRFSFGDERCQIRTRIILFENEGGNLRQVDDGQFDCYVSGPSPQPEKEQRTGWVSAEQLNQLKEEVDIVSMIESYGLEKFKRTGVNRATALCPFHDDHSPSLSIDGERRLYKCFACGAGGDIYRFVREYNKVTNGEDMSFMEAVKYVSDYSLGAGGRANLILGTTSAGSGSMRVTEEERKELQAKQQRIYSMNQAAAAFYVNCLTLPFAGGARHYLLSRGFGSPATARAFALGYAPDVFFDNRFLPPNQKSLVAYLKDLGFTASEMIESGLVIRTKKSEKQGYVPPRGEKNATKSNLTSHVTSNTDEEDDLDISSIMDRFRGRLIVPIFDKKGEKVLAFGGRILPSRDEGMPQSTGFKAPKYLNSPETLVFLKKNILFGHHMAIDGFQSFKRGSNSDRKPSQPDPLLIVEGYMDVLSLWDIGIETSVASMGTALSIEQLSAAAKIAGAHGSK